MKIHLVTGGSGYVGESIIERLSKIGEKVISLDVIPSDNKFNNVEYIKGSVLDKELIDSLISKVNYIHHNAALVPLTKSGSLFREVNLEGTRNILNAALKYNVDHFCHMSSSAVFGLPTELPLTNLSDRIPVEIYGQSKKDAEDLVISSMAANSNFSASIVRPRTILGTKRLGIFELLFKWISQGTDIFLIGEGLGLFQFAHINDIVNSSVQSCILKKKGIFNVGALEFSSLSEDLEYLTEYANTGSRVKKLPENITIRGLKILDKLNLSPFAPWHYLTYHKSFYFDSSYVFQELKFSPKGSNIECLKEAYDSYLKNKQQLNSKIDLRTSPHKSKLKANLIDLTARTLSLFP